MNCTFHITAPVQLQWWETLWFLSTQRIMFLFLFRCPSRLKRNIWRTMNCHQNTVWILSCVLHCSVSSVPFCICAVCTLSLLARPWLLPLSHTWPTDWPQLEAEAWTDTVEASDSADVVDLYRCKKTTSRAVHKAWVAELLINNLWFFFFFVLVILIIIKQISLCCCFSTYRIFSWTLNKILMKEK